MPLRRADAREMLERQCAEKGLSVEALQAGSRDSVGTWGRTSVSENTPVKDLSLIF